MDRRGYTADNKMKWIERNKEKGKDGDLLFYILYTYTFVVWVYIEIR